jgi:hypothetical protein
MGEMVKWGPGVGCLFVCLFGFFLLMILSLRISASVHFFLLVGNEKNKTRSLFDIFLYLCGPLSDPKNYLQTAQITHKTPLKHVFFWNRIRLLPISPLAHSHMSTHFSTSLAHFSTFHIPNRSPLTRKPPPNRPFHPRNPPKTRIKTPPQAQLGSLLADLRNDRRSLLAEAKSLYAFEEVGVPEEVLRAAQG